MFEFVVDQFSPTFQVRWSETMWSRLDYASVRRRPNFLISCIIVTKSCRGQVGQQFYQNQGPDNLTHIKYVIMIIRDMENWQYTSVNNKKWMMKLSWIWGRKRIEKSYVKIILSFIVAIYLAVNLISNRSLLLK